MFSIKSSSTIELKIQARYSFISHCLSVSYDHPSEFGASLNILEGAPDRMGALIFTYSSKIAGPSDQTIILTINQVSDDTLRIIISNNANTPHVFVASNASDVISRFGKLLKDIGLSRFNAEQYMSTDSIIYQAKQLLVKFSLMSIEMLNDANANARVNMMFDKIKSLFDDEMHRFKNIIDKNEKNYTSPQIRR